jgi:hypothetical protein
MKIVLALAVVALILAPAASSVDGARDPRVPTLQAKVAALQRKVTALQGQMVDVANSAAASSAKLDQISITLKESLASVQADVSFATKGVLNLCQSLFNVSNGGVNSDTLMHEPAFNYFQDNLQNTQHICH